jgi:hypothetical protein
MKTSSIRPQSSIVLRQSSIKMLFTNSKLKTKTSKLGVLCDKRLVFKPKTPFYPKTPCHFYVVCMSFEVVCGRFPATRSPLTPQTRPHVQHVTDNQKFQSLSSSDAKITFAFPGFAVSCSKSVRV